MKKTVIGIIALVVIIFALIASMFIPTTKKVTNTSTVEEKVVKEEKKDDKSEMVTKLSEKLKSLFAHQYTFKDEAIQKEFNDLKQVFENLKKEVTINELEKIEQSLNDILKRNQQTVSQSNTTELNHGIRKEHVNNVVVYKPNTTANVSQPKKEVNKSENKSEQTKPIEKKVTPMKEEIDTVLTEKIDTIMHQWGSDNYIPGGVVLVAKDGKIIAHKAYGYKQSATKDSSSPYHAPVYVPLQEKDVVTLDTMYDLASVTKVMSTTQAIMKLVSENKLDLDAKVSKYLPGFEQNGKQDVTVKSLLTHTSGLPQWEPTYFYGNTKSQQLEFIKKVALNSKFVEDGVGNKMHHYSDLGFMTLGYIVEAITQQDLDVYVSENIYQPLQLNTTYNPIIKGFTNFASTSFGNPYEYKMVDEENYPKVGYDTSAHSEKFKQFNGWRDYVLKGEVNDGNAGMATKGVAGHAGLFSTAKDLAILGEVMLNKGTYDNVQLYKPEVVELFTTKQTNTNIVSEEFGYAFKLDQSWMGDSASEKVFGHDGFTGTYVSYDPEHHLQIIVLTNKMQSGFRKGTLPSGKPHNVNLYWNISSMVKSIANETRKHLGF